MIHILSVGNIADIKGHFIVKAKYSSFWRIIPGQAITHLAVPFRQNYTGYN